MRALRKKWVAVLLVFSMIIGAHKGGDIKVSAAGVDVKLAKKSVSLMIEKSNSGTKYGTAKVKVKMGKGVAVKKVSCKVKKKGIATISVKGKAAPTLTIKAKKQGSTQITVSVRYKKAGKIKTKKLTLKIKVVVKERGNSAVTEKLTVEPTESPSVLTPSASSTPTGSNETRSPGIYNSKSGKLDKTWDELVKGDYLMIKDGVIVESNVRELPYDDSWYLVLGNDVSGIASGAFGGHDCQIFLSGVSISSSVVNIEEGAFGMFVSEGEGTIIVNPNNSVYDSRNNCNAIIKTDTNKLIRGCNKTVIPNEVTSIGYGAFMGCSSLTSITIPDGVTSIGDGAFSECRGLTSITIPDGVTSVGDYAFMGCSSLTSITIPDGVTSIGDGAFESCSGLTSITIPDGVTSIGDYAFESCSGLTSITIPDGVTSIGYHAFNGCSGLTSITIPDGVTSIGDGAFESCSGLTSITIPDGVTSIGDYAFESCSGLTSITIPDGVTSIGDGAFWDCSGLTSITIPEGVTSIGDNAFLRVKKIIYNGTATGSPWGADSVAKQ